MNRRLVAALCGLGLIIALPQGARADPNVDYPERITNVVECLLDVPGIGLQHRGQCLTQYEEGEIYLQPLPFLTASPSAQVQIYYDQNQIHSFVKEDPDEAGGAMYEHLRSLDGLRITGRDNSRCFAGQGFTACIIGN